MLRKNGRWSLKYDYCQDCGTDVIKYGGLGRCKACYQKLAHVKATQALYFKSPRGKQTLKKYWSSEKGKKANLEHNKRVRARKKVQNG